MDFDNSTSDQTKYHCQTEGFLVQDFYDSMDFATAIHIKQNVYP
jgi:hypothetical protein